MWREQEHLILRLYGHDDPPRIIAVTAKSKGTGKVRTVDSATVSVQKVQKQI